MDTINLLLFARPLFLLLFAISSPEKLSILAYHVYIEDLVCIIEFIKRVGEKIRSEALSGILSIFPNKL